MSPNQSFFQPIWDNRFLKLGNKTILKSMPSSSTTAISLLKNSGLNQVKDVLVLQNGHYRLKSHSELQIEVANILHQRQFQEIFLHHINIYATITRLHTLLNRIWDNIPTLNVPLIWSTTLKNGTVVPIASLEKKDTRGLLYNFPEPPTNYKAINYPEGTTHDEHTWKHLHFTSQFLLPMESDLMWRILHNGLNVGHKFQFMIDSNPLCSIGCNSTETIHHLFWTCPLSKAIWIFFLPMWRDFWINPLTWVNILDPSKLKLKPHLKSKIGKSTTLAFSVMRAIIFKTIWYNRNAIIYNDPSLTSDCTILQKIVAKSFQRHWISINRLGTSPLKNHLRRVFKILSYNNRFREMMEQ